MIAAAENRLHREETAGAVRHPHPLSSAVAGCSADAASVPVSLAESTLASAGESVFASNALSADESVFASSAPSVGASVFASNAPSAGESVFASNAPSAAESVFASEVASVAVSGPASGIDVQMPAWQAPFEHGVLSALAGLEHFPLVESHVPTS